MWESPINVMEIQDSFVNEIKEKIEEMVFTEIKRIGIEVDKEELIKALQYDRGQYEKGYSDGYVKAIDEAIKASASAICIGCGYLDGYECTYKGCNCGVSKQMLESVVKALEKLKGE